MHHRNQAFTLIELAIVIVIVGLIVGGVLGAQSLIKSATKQSVAGKVETIRAAYWAFQLEYDAVPGDMEDALDYFGADCTTMTAPSFTGCNGNGDGKLNEWPADTSRFWPHLHFAELLPYQQEYYDQKTRCL